MRIRLEKQQQLMKAEQRFDITDLLARKTLEQGLYSLRVLRPELRLQFVELIEQEGSNLFV